MSHSKEKELRIWKSCGYCDACAWGVCACCNNRHEYVVNSENEHNFDYETRLKLKELLKGD